MDTVNCAFEARRASVTTELGFEFSALGGPCELRLVGPDESLLRHAAHAAVLEVKRIEHKYSRYDTKSLISLINSAAGSGMAVEVDDETSGLLTFADRLHQLSGGLFDITSGVLRRAWDFSRAELPSAQAIEALLPLVGWHEVVWRAPYISLPRREMEIDFGGFGKEYAVDRATTLLRRAGVAHGFVNLGGDICLLGPREDGCPWRMGIQHPRNDQRLAATVSITSGAMATSGDYERFIEVDGHRYCHLLDPRTGWPARHWQSITVFGPTCAAAGAASTVSMLLGEAATDFLEAQDMGFVVIDAAGRMRHHNPQQLG